MQLGFLRLTKTCLNERGVVLHEYIRELISSVNFVKQWIYIIVLNKVTVSSADKVYSTRYNWWSIWLPYYSRQYILALFVVFQLLAQWNCMLDQMETKKKKHPLLGFMNNDEKWKKNWSFLNWQVYIYIKLSCGIVVARSSWGKVGTVQEVFSFDL